MLPSISSLPLMIVLFSIPASLIVQSSSSIPRSGTHGEGNGLWRSDIDKAVRRRASHGLDVDTIDPAEGTRSAIGLNVGDAQLVVWKKVLSAKSETFGKSASDCSILV